MQRHDFPLLHAVHDPLYIRSVIDGLPVDREDLPAGGNSSTCRRSVDLNVRDHHSVRFIEAILLGVHPVHVFVSESELVVHPDFIAHGWCGGHDRSGCLKVGFVELDLHRYESAVPVHTDADVVTRSFHRDHLLQLSRAFDRFAIEFDDHIVDAKALGFRRPPFSERGQFDTGNRGQAVLLGRDVVDRAHPDAEPGPTYSSVLDQVLHDAVRQVDGDRESVPLVESRFAGDRGVDADDLAPEVDHRPSRVSGVDHGVGLDEVLDGVSADSGRYPVLLEPTLE